jgi:hypothetical protein
MKYIIFDCVGGIGKNVMATAVVANIKQKYQEHNIIVTSGWPAVWVSNPNVYRVYPFGRTNYFFDDFIRDKEVIIMKHEPYHHQDYLLKKRHLVDVWCEQCGVEYDTKDPQLYYSWREEQYIQHIIGSDKYAVIQMSGGTNNPSKYSWVRDIPIHQAQSIVDYLIVQGYKVFQLKEKNALELNNVVKFETENIRDLFGLIKFSSKRILIDSYSQHVAACFNLPSVVCWPIDNVSGLGYDLHKNITSNADKHVVHKIDSYLVDDVITGNFHECPFVNNEIFDLQEIYKAINE